MWLDGGGLAAAAKAQEEPAAEPEKKTPEPTLEPTPLPEPTPAPTSEPEPVVTPPPSDIVLPTAVPTPSPKPTLKPDPTPTSKPKPTPSPKPKPTSKPTPKPTSKPKETPKPSPKPTAKKDAKSETTPKPKTTPGKSADDPATAASKAAFKKANGEVDTGASGDSTQQGTAPGTGGGNRGGNGHIGGGNHESNFGWYHSMLRDRFTARWNQPTSIVQSNQKFVTRVKIKIEKDGRISNVELANSSGNVIMDESVMVAARHVTQVDPLPSGLGDSYEVKIDFELNQQ